MLKPHTSLLAIFCCVALVGYAGMSSHAEPKLVTESYMIPSRDPGIHLYVRNKRPEGMTQFSRRENAAVRARHLSGSVKYIRFAFGWCLVDGLHRTAWLRCLSCRSAGYGGSTRPPEMEKPAAENPPSSEPRLQ